MLELLITLALLTVAPIEPVQSIADVRDLVAADVVAADIVARIEAADVYLKLEPQELVQLYYDGAAPSVLAAIVATTGEPYPRVVEEAGQIELHYDGYRILGRGGPGGPKLVVSGYARSGERLKPAVESPPVAAVTPAVADERTALAATRLELEETREQLEAAAERLETRVVEPVAPVVNVNLNTAPAATVRSVTVNGNGQIVGSAQVTYDSYGLPQYLTVTQIPQASLDRGILVEPAGAPSYGFGYYGYGNPYYGAYGFAAGGASTTSVGCGTGAIARDAGWGGGGGEVDARAAARRDVVRDRRK